MLVLALDTALSQTSVALCDGGRVDAARSEPMERGHSERLFALVDAVLREAGLAIGDVDRFAVGIGPGSFTGIRVAIAAARGFALATGKPVVGVDTLTALAASLAEKPNGPVLAAVDARRGEVYAGLFDAHGRVLIPPFAADADGVFQAVGDRASVIVGSGAAILAHHAVASGLRVPPTVDLAGPDPRAIARLAAGLTPESRPPAPLYLRPPDAKPQAGIAGLLRQEAG
ncbi:tRNA (adenosine(37)-N6)-threonylcarbamoyltransferase complex dimerization subunit type 1 TsaB [Chthonobacter albigriseus]|uniref:tRNA (adenosine(37)-N6)-threonylcarbamoyltransferase complex dimerization subunit type 1 TsaB n=1 Tax=Chthonobacter albigriseus TaxID=1683161 RepID=UPI0015EEC517|nr:tRNA (adenosine(37)-N6)-threonylcarbamoyltransferase complex dimerization subunit type 1 TsaB [Chthonobacter albigriseus]